MKIDLEELFKYFNPNLKHHAEAVALLEKELAKSAPELVRR